MLVPRSQSNTQGIVIELYRFRRMKIRAVALVDLPAFGRRKDPGDVSSYPSILSELKRWR